MSKAYFVKMEARREYKTADLSIPDSLGGNIALNLEELTALYDMIGDVLEFLGDESSHIFRIDVE